MPDLENIFQKTQQNAIILKLQELGIKLAGAIALFIIGLYIIKFIKKLNQKFIDKSNLDTTVKGFFLSFIDMVLKIILVITVIGYLGIPTSSILAVLGASSLAIGLALQGSLSNFAGGILLLILRPIKVGDYVEISGKSGSVESIQLFTTKLVTLDNKTIFIPNSKVSNSEITNYSEKPKRRLDQVYSVGYTSDIEKVKSILKSEIKKIDYFHSDPEPFVALSKHSESSIDFTIRVWVDTDKLWDGHFALLENVKTAFDKEGIEIPFNKLDVNLIK